MAAPKVCSVCGTEFPPDAQFCLKDGTPLRPPASAAAASAFIGTIVADRYRILRAIGEGGMGSVYLAEHVRIGRRSALKVMRPDVAHDPDAVSRFNREASNASRIDHPNVASIYDFGETSDGMVYLAMEYVDGESLGEMLQRTGALAAPRAAEIVRQAADALAAAHEMGIVHRDLKPDNIMLMLTRNRDGSDRVKVVDFGLAKVPQGENQNVTSTGIIVGTPAYMSPEQVTGDVLDGRSDIYALALVAYNLLTGALPFTGETTRDMLVSRLTDPPRTLAEARPDIAWPKALQDVFTRALAVRPSNRYQKVGDFADDFVAATATMPGSRTTVAPSVVAALAASRATDAASARVQASWWHRRRVIVIAGVVTIALCVAAGIWGALALRDRPVPARVAPRATIVRPAPIRAPRPGVRR